PPACGHPRPHGRLLLPRRRRPIVDDSERPCLSAQRPPPERRVLCPPAHGDQRCSTGNAPASNQRTPDDEFFGGRVSGAFSESTQGRICAPPKSWKRSRKRLHF